MKAICYLQIMFLIICSGCATQVSQNWRESRSLVKLWPRLQKENIVSIRFYDAVNLETGTYENESFIEQKIESIRFREREPNVVKSWHMAFEVPKQKLPECINIIDQAMKHAKPNWFVSTRVWLGRMLIVTDKRKYIVHVETCITNVEKSYVYGEEWESYELGEFLKKCGFPTPDANKAQ